MAKVNAYSRAHDLSEDDDGDGDGDGEAVEGAVAYARAAHVGTVASGGLKAATAGCLRERIEGGCIPPGSVPVSG